jgi:hypothetical protein
MVKYVKDFEFSSDKGFSGSTGVQLVKGYARKPGMAMGGMALCGMAKGGMAKGGPVKGRAKIGKVMGEFDAGKLHSGSKKGPEVTNPKQAMAIALSEARAAGAKVPVKKAMGGYTKC